MKLDDPRKEHPPFLQMEWVVAKIIGKMGNCLELVRLCPISFDTVIRNLFLRGRGGHIIPEEHCQTSVILGRRQESAALELDGNRSGK